jgi:hypothetical protein
LLIFEKPRLKAVKYLFSFVLFFICKEAYTQLTYETVWVDYDSVFQYKNLKIIPIRPKTAPGNAAQGMVPHPGVLSLSQAIKQGLATITERGTASTENVHWLRINNHSDKSLFVSSGELIAGGRQDRMVFRDTILAPSSKDQYISVMCVEELRWSDKEKKFAYGNFANPFLRKVLDESKNQVLIWKEIGSQLGQGEIKNKTLSYMARNNNKKMLMINDDYFRFFQQKFRNADSSILGFVAISGNRVIGCDIFAWTDLFYSQLEPLLRGYIDGAVYFGAPVNMPDKPVKEYMDNILTNERIQEEFVNKNGKVFRQDGRVIHINTF